MKNDANINHLKIFIDLKNLFFLNLWESVKLKNAQSLFLTLIQAFTITGELQLNCNFAASLHQTAQAAWLDRQIDGEQIDRLIKTAEIQAEIQTSLFSTQNTHENERMNSTPSTLSTQ